MGGKRVFELMLEIGHKSSPLNKKLTNGYTHKWTAYVKGVNNSNIEHCIQRVVFQLHESFDNPYRDVSEAPFQVKETGYAGFEMPIQIYFKNRERPNHIVFTYDLSLLASKPNDSSTIERLKFINPNREFEKCLIKSGAQLLPSALKKERSNSPPAKKHKSSSLIPSKDMSKLAQPQQQSHHTQAKPHAHQQHSSQHPSTQPHANHHNANNSNNHHHHHHHHTHNQHHKSSGNHHSTNGVASQLSSSKHQQQSQVQQSALPGVPRKSQPKEFIDVFGAPLVFNGQTNGKEQPHHQQPAPPPPPPVQAPQPQQQHHHHNHHHHHQQHHQQQQQQPPPPSQPLPQQQQPHKPQPNQQPPAHLQQQPQHQAQTKQQQNIEQFAHDLPQIQAKISSLADCDRLQRIVDIIEESGEWFNLTSKKFEFDLKRLDKKTLIKIEKCLQY